MGRDVGNVQAAFIEGPDEGRLQWEPPRLIFRGATRRVFEGADLAGVREVAGELILPGGARFLLGVPLAGRWAEAINNPPGRLDKLGIKPGMRVAVSGVDDAGFHSELVQRTQPLNEFSELDILIWAADSETELEEMPRLIPSLAPRGALWVVSRKGKAASLKDVQVMAAARAQGLVDNKVCSFSPTHTALRFVRRKA